MIPFVDRVVFFFVVACLIANMPPTITNPIARYFANSYAVNPNSATVILFPLGSTYLY